MDCKINENDATVDIYSEKNREEYTDFLLSRDESNIYHTD